MFTGMNFDANYYIIVSVMQIKFMVIHTKLYYLHYWIALFCVLLYALRVICVFVLRSLIATRICKITVVTCWLTDTNYTYTNI